MRAPEPARKDGPRINEEIRVREVHLIDRDGANKGTVSIADALAAAQEAGLDLVEISPNAAPPIVKILDYGKYKYQEQKKAAEARKKQKVVEVKEIKYRPMIDDHDYDVKMRSMKRFFEEGDKVKVTLRFRGREMAHQELGARLLERVKEDVGKIAKVDAEVVNRVADAAEEANHHPDILVHGWNNVRLTLSTHSKGGLTDADHALARRIDGVVGG